MNLRDFSLLVESKQASTGSKLVMRLSQTVHLLAGQARYCLKEAQNPLKLVVIDCWPVVVSNTVGQNQNHGFKEARKNPGSARVQRFSAYFHSQA